MAASGFKFYENNIDVMKLSDLSSATIKAILVTSTHTPNNSETGHTTYSDITNELSTANGYTNGGVTLTSPTIAAVTDGFKFSTGNAAWTASGGAIAAHRYLVLYASGSLWGLTNPLIGFVIGDSTPADIPATADGQTLTYTCPANGWFTVKNTTA